MSSESSKIIAVIVSNESRLKDAEIIQDAIYKHFGSDEIQSEEIESNADKFYRIQIVPVRKGSYLPGLQRSTTSLVENMQPAAVYFFNPDNQDNMLNACAAAARSKNRSSQILYYGTSDLRLTEIESWALPIKIIDGKNDDEVVQKLCDEIANAIVAIAHGNSAVDRRIDNLASTPAD